MTDDKSRPETSAPRHGDRTNAGPQGTDAFDITRRLWSEKDGINIKTGSALTIKNKKIDERESEDHLEGDRNDDRDSLEHSNGSDIGHGSTSGKGTKNTTSGWPRKSGMLKNLTENTTDLLTDSKDEGEITTDKEEERTTEMGYIIPFRLDLRKTSTNKEATPSEWLQKVLAGVQHSDKSAAILTRVQTTGERRRYLTAQEILEDVTGEVKIKAKQYRNSIRTMFAEIETTHTSIEVRRLPGIVTMNSQAMTYRADKYSGDLTASVGWLVEVHPTLTNIGRLEKMIRDAMSIVRVSKEYAQDFQDKLQHFDNRKTVNHSKLQVPPFHISMEVNLITQALPQEPLPFTDPPAQKI